MHTTTPITYDNSGRMRYHPAYHPNHGRAWTTADEQYLIECYDALGPEALSFALGRTIHTVMTRAYALRKQGRLATPTSRRYHRRLHATPEGHA